MKHHFLLLRLTVVLSFLFVCGLMHAEVLHGTCGENITYTLNTETWELRLSGSGEMGRFQSEDASYLSVSCAHSVVVGYGITRISNSAFNNWWQLSSVSLPSSLKEIGVSAFWDCHNLSSVSIPDGVEVIESGAFSFCSELSSVSLPKNLKKIGSSCFWGCSKLTHLTIPEGVTEISMRALSGLDGLKSISLPSTLKAIRSGAFEGCISLKTIQIPYSVDTIGYTAFEGCTALETIEFPDKNIYIESHAFEGCTGLKSLRIPYHLTDWKTYVFEDCSSLKDIYVPWEYPIMVLKNNFSGCGAKSEINLHVPQNAVENYTKASFFEKNYLDWSAFNIVGSEPAVSPRNSTLRFRFIDGAYGVTKKSNIEFDVWRLGGEEETVPALRCGDWYVYQSEHPVFSAVIRADGNYVETVENVVDDVCYEVTDEEKYVVDCGILPECIYEEIPADTCALQLEMIDLIGEGWNGSKLHARYADGREMDFTLNEGAVGTAVIPYYEEDVTFSWRNGGGTSDDACWFIIKYPNGRSLYTNMFSSDPLTHGATVTTLTGDLCHQEPSSASPKNLRAELEEDGRYTLSWSPVTGAYGYVVTLVDEQMNYVHTCDTVLIVHIVTEDTKWHLERPLYVPGRYYWVVRPIGDDGEQLILTGHASSVFEVMADDSFEMHVNVIPQSGFNSQNGLLFAYYNECNEVTVPMEFVASSEPCTDFWKVSVPQPSENTLFCIYTADKSQATRWYPSTLFESGKCYHIYLSAEGNYDFAVFPDALKLNVEVPYSSEMDVSKNGLWIRYQLNREEIFKRAEADPVCPIWWTVTLDNFNGWIPGQIAFTNGDQETFTQQTKAYCFHDFGENKYYQILKLSDIGVYPDKPQLELVAKVIGEGKVTVSPQSSDGFYVRDTELQLTATPAKDYEFAGWFIDNAENNTTVNPLSLKMDCHHTVYALFRPIGVEVYYSLSTGNPKLISVSEPPHRSLDLYREGTVLALRYLGEPCSEFAGWVVDGVLSDEKGEQLMLTMDKNHSVSVLLKTRCDFLLQTNASPAYGGTVAVPNWKARYCSHDVVDLKAVPKKGYCFVEWSDGEQSAAREVHINCQNHSLTAVFEKLDAEYFQLDLVDEDSIHVSISPHRKPNLYKKGTKLTLRPEEYRCDKFVGWEVNGVLYKIEDGEDEKLELTMNQDYTVRAVFKKKCDFKLVTHVSPEGAGSVTIWNKQSEYCAHDVVTMIAEPAEGYRFVRWSDNKTSAKRQLDIACASWDLTAIFELIPEDPNEGKFYLKMDCPPLDSSMVHGTLVYAVVHEDDMRPQDPELEPLYNDTVAIDSTRLHIINEEDDIDSLRLVYDRALIIGDSVYMDSTYYYIGDSTDVVGTHYFHAEDSVLVQIKQTEWQRFEKWDDEVTDTMRLFVMTQNYEVCPIFKPYYLLTLLASEGGSVNAEEVNGWYPSDSTIHIVATSNAGYIFDKWSDENKDAVRDIQLSSDSVLTAFFTAKEGIENVQTIHCQIVGGILHIEGCDDMDMRLYTVVGQVLYAGRKKDILLPQRGVYLLCIDSKVLKIRY